MEDSKRVGNRGLQRGSRRGCDGIAQFDYSRTPRQFVSDHETMHALERSIAALRHQQAQLTLMGNPTEVAALEPQIAALAAELNVLKAQYHVV
jgi:uncharacterized protein involved in exopolysaccharide biosynthesis